MSEAKRVSLACVPCREKHLRCDATRPACRRCTVECKECHYAKSRRGGLDKAALAARRERLARQETALLTPPHHPDAADAFVAQYYDAFHRYHPFVLPRRKMRAMLETEPRLKPVLSAMRLIGATYMRSGELALLSKQLDEDIAAQPLDPFTVQAQLLQAIHTFWSMEKPKSAEVMAQAVESATAQGMHERFFAATAGNGDPVLEESWRRTWWWMYLSDATISHIKKENGFACRDVPATADLPCEDAEYEACVSVLGALLLFRTNSQTIPAPSTLDDYDNREFTGREFSSLAYAVGITRSVARVLRDAPFNKDNWHTIDVVNAFDAVADGWLMLLPEPKRRVMNGGEVDEAMFFAHMGLHAGLCWVHRPFSDLLYDPLERISSCSTAPHETQPSPEGQHVHSTRCFASIEAQVRLMMLPKRPFSHSPFIICAVITCMIPFLSACRFLLAGQRLAAARDQIRLSIGCLKGLAETWTTGVKNVEEVQAIARKVLGLGEAQTPASQSSDDLLFTDTLDEIASCWDFNGQLDTSLIFAEY